jgi:hypothetical protein
MPFLEAALVRDAIFAYILTIFVFSLLVTQILNIFLIVSGRLRSKEIQNMLEEFFKFEFQPVIQREMQRLRKELKLGEKLVSELNFKAEKLNKNVIFTDYELSRSVSLTTEELIERLKRSEFGHHLLMKLGDKAQGVFNELGKRYKIVGDRFTNSWRIRNRILAFYIAFILAFVFNIDSIYIFNTYLQHEDTCQAVASQNDAFAKDYDALAETLEKEQGKNSFTKADLEQAFKNSREQLTFVSVSGLPIGMSYFPYSFFEGKTQKEWGASQDFKNRDNPSGWTTWILGIILSAVLAGIGGPFWYDVAVGITRTVEAAAKK